MTAEMIFIFILIIGGLYLFATEKLPFDVTALIIMGALMVTGILTPSEGLSGFSHPATVTIACMFIVSEAFRQTGALRLVGAFFSVLGKKKSSLAVAAIFITIIFVAAFINNTAAVAIFIPVIIGVSKNMDMAPSKLLMPMSFLSNYGGLSTLIGTSTNILVSSIALQRGLEPFGMFEFTFLAVILMVVGFVYIFFYAMKKIPAYDYGPNLTADYNLEKCLADLELKEGYKHIGKTIAECLPTKYLDLDIVRVFRGEESQSGRSHDHALKEGDVLRVRGKKEDIDKIEDRKNIELHPRKKWMDEDIKKGRDILLEATILSQSNLVGQNVKELNLDERFGAVLLGVRHKGKLIEEDMGEVKIAGGDSLLMVISRDRVSAVEKDSDFVVVSKVETKGFQRKEFIITAAILFGIVLTAALNILPIVTAALVGAIMLVITKCLTVEEAYRAVKWKVIFLLAGVLTLGVAMDSTGAALFLSNQSLSVLEPFGPQIVLSGFFLLTMLLSNMISKQAAAALFAPVAIQAALTMGVSPRPFLMAVAFASSLTFITPLGNQNNIMVYSAGRYSFKDFIKIGTPLSIIMWLLATWLIPMLWKF